MNINNNKFVSIYIYIYVVQLLNKSISSLNLALQDRNTQLW